LLSGELRRAGGGGAGGFGALDISNVADGLKKLQVRFGHPVLAIFPP
jgi:hypothetical protein